MPSKEADCERLLWVSSRHSSPIRANGRFQAVSRQLNAKNVRFYQYLSFKTAEMPGFQGQLTATSRPSSYLTIYCDETYCDFLFEIDRTNFIFLGSNLKFERIHSNRGSVIYVQPDAAVAYPLV